MNKMAHHIFWCLRKKQNKKKSHRLPLWYNVSYHTDKVPGGNYGSHISYHISSRISTVLLQ